MYVWDINKYCYMYFCSISLYVLLSLIEYDTMSKYTYYHNHGQTYFLICYVYIS